MTWIIRNLYGRMPRHFQRDFSAATAVTLHPASFFMRRHCWFVSNNEEEVDVVREQLKSTLTLDVNGKRYELPVGSGLHEVAPSETLVQTLRDRLGLTGAKLGCGQGTCGCCTVILGGRAVASCMTLTLDCEGAQITTIEGLADAATGTLNDLQQAFVEKCGFQCGYCTAGIIMTAQALLDENPSPSEEEVREALAGNYCRCGTHYTAVDAIMACVEKSGREA